MTGQKIIANSAKHFKKLSLELGTYQLNLHDDVLVLIKPFILRVDYSILGGKNANIVFDDCNLDKAIEGSIRAAFSNQGEVRPWINCSFGGVASFVFVIYFASLIISLCAYAFLLFHYVFTSKICLCGSRIFVHSSIYSQFLDAFVMKAKALVLGDPADSKTQVGALNSEQHMQKVLGYIELAKEEGGNIVCGGNKKVLEGELKDGYFVEPTVITG